MKEIIKRIEEHYNIKVDDFLELYELGYSRDEIAEQLSIGVMPVRQIGASLGLRFKKKHRSTDLDILKRRLESEEDLVIQLTNDLEFMNEKALKLHKSLIKCRDENNFLRKQVRLSAREEKVLEEIREELKKIIEVKIEPVIVEHNSPYYIPNGLNLVVLSDLHIGAKVEKENVGDMNEFNYDIAIKRIDAVFDKLLKMSYQSENLTIAILGDIFDGIIHGSQLIAEMPVTKAIAQFSAYIVAKVKSLSKAYKNIKLEIISGNHERLFDDPVVIHKPYDFSHIFFELVKTQLNDIVEINYAFKGYHKIELPNNKWAFAFHGDMNRGYSPLKETEILKAMQLAKQVFDIEPYLILSGHLHKYMKTMLPNGGFAIGVGSLMGTNQYSYNNGWLAAIPSQVILFLNEKGEIEKEKVVNFDI